ncbi:hypothetical protein [Occallatibacter savannae]|uniref:hypothetical protein n=1 Tax=Occallatibacter savannae TaxID=1002691 RepID=UPI000D6995CB|nr:hypothetical protein [Occallatibacter savannae]
MSYPKQLKVDATYTCGHILHLAKTVYNELQEEDFVFTGLYEVCPECREASRIRYSEVYEMLKDKRYYSYQILFERHAMICGDRLHKELLLDFSTTSFFVEYNINQKHMKPVGLYKGTVFLPFEGYTVAYMEWLLESNEESILRYQKNSEEAKRRVRYLPEWQILDQ